MKKRTLALLVALVLVVGCIIGGTLAWLTAKTDAVVNTFTTIHKDPKTTVVKGSEECYLFVKVEKSANFDSFMTYEMADGWTALEGVEGVYYREVRTADMGTEFSVLKDDQVTVKGEVTKEMMAEAEKNKPTLTITAYASQLYKNNTEIFTAAEAWANVPKN